MFTNDPREWPWRIDSILIKFNFTITITKFLVETVCDVFESIFIKHWIIQAIQVVLMQLTNRIWILMKP